jgi:hypothetical protein
MSSVPNNRSGQLAETETGKLILLALADSLADGLTDCVKKPSHRRRGERPQMATKRKTVFIDYNNR